MARGSKVDNEKIQEIIASYALTNNYNKTAKEVGVAANTVKNVINKQKEENPEEYAKVCEEKKELFSQKANRVIDKAMNLLERRFDTALENEDTIEELINVIMTDDSSDEKTSYQEKLAIAKRLGRLQINSLSEITTSMGTLYDKMRLDSDKPTENNKLDVTIRVVE